MVSTLGKFGLPLFFSCQSIRPWPNIGQNLKFSYLNEDRALGNLQISSLVGYFKKINNFFLSTSFGKLKVNLDAVLAKLR